MVRLVPVAQDAREVAQEAGNVPWSEMPSAGVTANKAAQGILVCVRKVGRLEEVSL
jgi:hypothetical protein